ncbi:MAG: transporter [Porticoccaceae bacterium]|nr:transporter [Porticoccaceae bacterium]
MKLRTLGAVAITLSFAHMELALAADDPLVQKTADNTNITAAASEEDAKYAETRAKVNEELNYLKNANLQLMRRIQALERQISIEPAQGPGAAPSPAGDKRANRTAQASTATDGATNESKVKKSADKSRGVSDLILEEHTLFDQSFSLEVGFEMSHFDQNQLILNGFLALDAIFLGDLSVDEIEGDIFRTTLLGRWGVTDRMQLSLAIPWVYRETTTRSRGVDLSSIIVSEKSVDDSDIGDISLGLSYQLFAETYTRPDIVLNFGVTAPTGRDPYGIDFIEDPTNTNLVFPSALPTGSGLWQASAGVSFLKSTDPAILFASFNYIHYFEKSFGDIGADPDAAPSPGDVQLGDAFQIAAGIAFAINERTSYSMSFTQRWTDEAEITQPGVGSQEIIGSDGATGTFDIGVTYALTDRLSMVTNLGMGLTNETSDYRFSLKFPYRF